MIAPREIKLVSKVTTPRWVHKYVLELASIIGVEPKAVWIPVQAAKGCVVNECFHNVPKVVAIKGGGIQYGWTVWQCANLYIEGEFHALWVSPQRDWIDITPKTDKETRILFIPDNRRTWEGSIVDNIRHPMIDRPEINEFIRLSKEQFNIQKTIKIGTTSVAPPDYIALAEQKSRLSVGAARYIPPATVICPCESGRHFGNCCGKL